MTTRMQQRRGTSTQWTNADPILAAGEIGVETDTNQFKLGDGINVWSDLSYFKNLEDLGSSLDDYVPLSQKGQADGVATLDSTGNIPAEQLGNIIEGAPAALDTLNEIASALNDDATFAATVVNALATKAPYTYVDNHKNDTTDVHGIADTGALATKTYATGVAQAAADIAKSDAAADATTKAAAAESAATAAASTDAETKVSNHNNDTTDVHGIADTQALATKTYADGKASDAQSAAVTAAGTAADTKISTHNADTTDVHGIADTAALATKTYADGKVSDAVAALTKSSVGLGNVDNTSDANKPVSSATQTALDLKANLAGPTFTGTVSGITKSMVGLGNVDNTSDANKPVSTATQTALDAKASLSGATFTGAVSGTSLTLSGNLTVNGTTTTVNTTNFTTSDPVIYLGEGNNANSVDLGFVASYNDGTYAHQGLVKDTSDGKWKLFKGVTDEPTTTVNFAQGSMDALKVGAFEATTVTPSSGIVFSDGTQTKVGVPSITTFATAISSSATLAAGEQDKFVPLTGAVQITLPATGYSTGQSIDFYQASGTGASFASTNSVVGTPGLKFRTTNSVVTAMKTSNGWLVFGDLSA